MEIVVPGEIVSDQPMRSQNTNVEDGKTYAVRIALKDSRKGTLVPLEGVWRPHVGDIVVGIVTGQRSSVYDIELNYFERSILVSGKYESHPLSPGELIEAKVKDVENRRTVILAYPKSLHGGTIVEAAPSKVPRIIGKEDTMVRQISEMTGTQIVVGKNGIIWIRGDERGVLKAKMAIKKIEDEAHIPGLTERIKQMLEKNSE
ncbi:MAG: hypothetical protein KGH98_01450 [Candidatus Micrarchaeota archaeon]|nr:hypothetical protein [Candidatus Micrarchaeota archaeon]